jgi:DNA-binding CsgD family transcriptional regulator
VRLLLPASVGSINAVCCIVLLGVSLLCARSCRRSLGASDKLGAAAPASADKSAAAARAATDSRVQSLKALRTMATPIVGELLFTLVIGMVNMFAYASNGGLQIAADAPIWALLICACVTCAVALFATRVPNPSVIYLGIVPIITAVFLILPFVGAGQGQAMSVIIYSGYYFVTLAATWFYVREVIARGGRLYLAIGIVSVLSRLALVAGLAAGSGFATLQGGNAFMGTISITTVSIYCLVALIVLWAVGLQRRTRKAAAQAAEEPAAPALASTPTFEERFEARLAELTAAHHLTNRERDVLAQLARGSSANHIAEVLVIQTSTVQGYLKTLYAKLGINKRQQAIDLFTDVFAGKGE